MNLVRFNPIRDLDSLQNQVINRFFSNAATAWTDTRPNTWQPAVDIFETPEEIIVVAEVPGLNAKDLDVHLENNVLTIRGERHPETEPNGEYFLRIERAYGAFTRSFTIPGFVEDSRIKAECKDGVLKIMLPKKETAKPRRIELVSVN